MEEVKLNAFGSVFPDFKPTRSDRIYKKEVAQFGSELDQKTCQMVPVLRDPLDLDAQIQTFKDQCGMVQAQLLLKRGLAIPEDFAAKPGDYGDTSDLPDNINDAYQMNKALNDGVKIDLHQFKTDADIEKFVKEQIQLQLDAAKTAALPKEEAK